MFKSIKRANRGRKQRMKFAACGKAKGNGWKFTGFLEAHDGYAAEFISNDSDEPFYGWAIASVDNGCYEEEEEIDYVFGSGQQVFDDARYVITEEDFGRLVTTIPGYYTLTAAARHLDLSKAGTAKAAKSEGWKVYPVGNVHLYRVDDIREYRVHRNRTELAKKLGWRGRGLYRVDDVDIECPVCGVFAIEWPAPPHLSEKFMCLDGHEGEL